jgi:hypothetical protein
VELPTTAADGRPILQVACFDGNVKGNRYLHAGRASGSGLMATDSSSSSSSSNIGYFGAPHRRLWELHEQGPLPVSHSMALGSSSSMAASGNLPDDAEVELASSEQHQCHPHLTCARETSLFSGISDECGLAGAVCSHGQPLRGSMLAMPAPERFLYYDLLLSFLLTCADVKLLYLDTGCSFGAHVRAHLPDAAACTTIKVPWWHARGHGLSCFVKNSGFFLPGELREDYVGTFARSPEAPQSLQTIALWVHMRCAA